MSTAAFRSEDLVLLAWMLAAPGKNAPLNAFGVSSTLRRKRNRLIAAGLLSPDGARPMRAALVDFVSHGLIFMFPMDVDTSRQILGVPTSWSAPPLSTQLLGPQRIWEYRGGSMKGNPVVPLHPTVARLARGNERFHRIMALMDAARSHDVRARSLAPALLAKEIGL